MAVRSRPVVAVLGLALGAVVTAAGCGTPLARQAAPAPAPTAPRPPHRPHPSPTDGSPERPQPSVTQSTASRDDQAVDRSRLESPPGLASTAPRTAPKPAPAKPKAVMADGLDAASRCASCSTGCANSTGSTGLITGRYGEATAEGVTGFQGKREARSRPARSTSAPGRG